MDAEGVLTRLWAEIRQAPELADLVSALPSDRAVSLADAFPLLALILTTPVLQGPERQLVVIDALGHAYARARGLHLAEG